MAVVASMMRAVAYMPDSSARPSFGHADVDLEVAVALVDFRRDRGELARERLAGLGLHRRPSAFMPTRRRPASSSDTPASSFISRRSATTTIGLSPGIEPGVVVALDDEAGHRRGDRGVALHFARAAQRRVGLRQIRGRQIALGDAGAMRGLGGIEALARQRALLEQVLRAIVFEHGVGESRFGGLERRLRDGDGGDRRIDLRIDLAAIDRRDGLAHRHRIADVDEHALDACRAASA